MDKPIKVNIGKTEEDIYGFKLGKYERFYAKKGAYVYKYAWRVLNIDQIRAGEVEPKDAIWGYIQKSKWLRKEFSPNIYDGITNKLFHQINKKLKVK